MFSKHVCGGGTARFGSPRGSSYRGTVTLRTMKLFLPIPGGHPASLLTASPPQLARWPGRVWGVRTSVSGPCSKPQGSRFRSKALDHVSEHVTISGSLLGEVAWILVIHAASAGAEST